MNKLKRINGYLDLDSYLKIGFDKINMRRDAKYNVIELLIDGQSYIYKSTSSTFDAYNELIVQRIAQHYNIPVAKYDLASFDNTRGVITYNFKKNDKLYIPMEEIFNVYENANKIDKVLSNNLVNIWNCLDYVLYFSKNKERKLQNLMDEITTMFCLDILIGNFDRHTQNFMLEFDFNEDEVHLAPLYDHSLSFDEFNLTLMGVGYNDTGFYYLDRFEMLEKYLNISSSEFIDKFKMMYQDFNIELIDSIFKDIENLTKVLVPEDIKTTIYRYIRMAKDKIDEILNEIEKKAVK